jgi:hypothetical protein
MSSYSADRLFSAMMLLLLLNGCRSAHFPAWFPPVSSYHAARPLAAPAIDSTARPMAAEPEVLVQPELTAFLPAEVRPEASLAVRSHSLTSIGTSNRPIYQAPPDTTSSRRYVKPTPDQIRAADNINTIVNLVGVVFLLGAVGLMITASSTSPGWGSLAAGLYGIFALFISLPLLFYRNAKSTKYLMRRQREGDSVPGKTVRLDESERPTAGQVREADKNNRFFHSLGVALLVLAAISIILSLIGILFALPFAIVALLISIPLLLFESTKSTSYMLQQEERAARKARKGR